MLWKAFDKLLETHFRKEPDYTRLRGLEGNVWARIRQSKATPQPGVLAFPAWSSATLRYASLVLAVAVGLMASQLSPNKVQSDILGLEVFSPNAPYLISSAIDYTDPAPS